MLLQSDPPRSRQNSSQNPFTHAQNPFFCILTFRAQVLVRPTNEHGTFWSCRRVSRCNTSQTGQPVPAKQFWIPWSCSYLKSRRNSRPNPFWEATQLVIVANVLPISNVLCEDFPSACSFALWSVPLKPYTSLKATTNHRTSMRLMTCNETQLQNPSTMSLHSKEGSKGIWTQNPINPQTYSG